MVNPEIKRIINADFDALAMETLKRGHYAFYCFIYSFIR